MDQEQLTLEEQNQLKQDVTPTIQEEKGNQFKEEAEGKTLEVNLQALEEKDQQLLAHQESLPQQIEKDIQKGDVPPDPEKDFMGYMKWLGKTLHKQELLHTKQQHHATSQAEQLHSFYQQSVAAVKQKYHDFDKAADFIYDMRAKQLAAFSSIYPEMANQQVVDTVIGNELKQILQHCAQKNKNPAEVIYSIAQNIGYTNPQSNTVENLQEKHNSARTLAASNGLTPSGPISLDMLDKMPETEFSTWISDPKNKAAFNHLMQGK
ncbi:hypothetical protein [Bartonella sp. B30(2025)]